MLPLRICIYYEEVIFSKHFEEYEEFPLYPGLSKNSVETQMFEVET